MMKKKFKRPPPKTTREAPLPWQHPKPSYEDPNAQKNLEAIMQSPTYKMAIEDADFLMDDAALPARLQLDYLKAERTLKAYGIDRTIAVYGSTRIVERESAFKKLEVAKEAYHDKPDSDILLKQLKIAERILEKSCYYEMAREFGALVGEAGKGCADNHVTLMTGGGPGIMEAANRGAFDVGANSIGLNITLPHEQYPNPYITPELCFLFYYFAIRKMHFMKRAAALVVFPGGFGTMDELFEALTLIQTRKIAPIPVVFVGESYWSKVIDFEMLEIEGVIDPEDRELFWYADDAQEAWDGILAWHEENETPLF
jgi:uncharacterized protein (TIGR00730 family)